MINPENGGVISGRSKPETVWASTEAQGYEIDHALNKNPMEIYKSTTSTTTIKMTFPSPIKMTGFALINHNLTESATISLRFYTDANFTQLDTEKSISHAPKNTYVIINDISEYKYILLYIDNPGQSEIKIGLIYPGTSFQFPSNYTWDYDDEFNIVKEVDTTDEGIHFETPDEDQNEPVPEFTKLKITFRDIEREHYETFKALIRVGKKVLIPDYTINECFYGIFPDKKLPIKRKLEGDTFSLNFWEDAIGGENA